MQPHGFTFVEVVVALAIVSISLLALIKLHLVSIRLAETARITSNAVFLADQKIAETLALGYPKEGANCGTVEENAVCLHWQTEVKPCNCLNWRRQALPDCEKYPLM